MTSAEELARDSRIEDNLCLAKAIARKYEQRCAVPFGDLFSYASIGLVRAADAWDEARGVPFPTFAWRYMRAAIIDGIRAETRCRQTRDFVNPRATFEPIGNRENIADPQATVSRLDASIDIRSLQKLLDCRSVRIINSRFGAGKTFREIGAEEGISEDRASAIMQDALATMRDAVRGKKAA